MLVGDLLSLAVVHSATVHPLQSSKQAKVTSGQLSIYIHPVVGCLRSVAVGAAGG